MTSGKLRLIGNRSRPSTGTPTDPAWAAQRDASWYVMPDVHSVKVVHLADTDGWSLCGRSILADTLVLEPAAVPDGLRCRGNGCRQHWPASAATSTDFRADARDRDLRQDGQ